MNNDIIDIFEREQNIYDSALKFGNALLEGDAVPVDIFVQLTKNYGRLLKQIRRVTRISDRATGNLNDSKMELLDQVYYDKMTGLYNRRFLDETVNINLNAALQNQGSISIMMIDVDYFKIYNDTYGHSEGDICLRLVANALAQSLPRSIDYVARYGGEEFVVVLPNSNEEVARVVADQLLANICMLHIPHCSNTASPYVTISIGVTTVCVALGHSVERYLKCADEALYASKRSGRNRYTFFEFKEDVQK